MENNKIEKIIFEIRKKSNEIRTIDKFMDFAFNFKFEEFNLAPLQNKEELKTFLEICVMKKPKTVIEIGTAAGGTLFLLCKVLDENSKIVSIDLPEGDFGGELYPNWKKPIYHSFAKNKQELLLIRDNSQNKETLEKVKKLVGDKIDLLIIDGDHTYPGVKKDFELYSQIVSQDGLIIFHDINQKIKNVEVWKLWNELKSKYETFEIITFGEEKGFGIGIIYYKPTKDKFVKFLKFLNQEKDNRIRDLKNNPIAAILDLYRDRVDLQLAFPEVNENNFDNIIKWVVNNWKNQTSEKDAIRILSNYNSWYDKFKNNLDAKLERNVLHDKLQNLGNQLKIAENTVGEKEEAVRKLESTVGEKEEAVRKLESIIKSKHNDLLVVNNELLEKITELNLIKNSKIFRIIRKTTNQIDKIFSRSKSADELKKITLSSARLIKEEGIKNYGVAVKEKLSKKEFKIITPFEPSEDQELKLIEQVEKNKKTKLSIKSHSRKEIEQDQININDNFREME